MKRELKFRVWDVDYGKMTEPFYLWQTPTCISCSETGGHSVKIDIQTPVMQYTGIKDARGVEICEGDIVNDGGTYVVITWEPSDASFRLENDYESDPLDLLHETARVIGNIYANPELLETPEKTFDSQ